MLKSTHPNPTLDRITQYGALALISIMLLAALAAKGKSTVRNIGQIERGYQDVDKKLKALGANIERIED